jgi:hypothetical protein
MVYGQSPFYYLTREFMVIKTVSDCKQCPYLTECDVHILKGTHKHQEGPQPCEFVFESDTLD